MSLKPANLLKRKKADWIMALNKMDATYQVGKKQRMTIARAIAKQAPILILDDSASALDFATDAKLREAIKNQTPRPTTFIVSQRAASCSTQT